MRVVGLILLLIPLLPLRALFGPVPWGGALMGPGSWLLGAGIFVAGGWLLSLPPVPQRALEAVAVRGERWARQVVALGMVLLLVELLSFSWSVFAHRPLLVDSVVQLFQARIFASGHLVAPAPRLPAFFITQNAIIDAHGWYGQYPPGHSALLVPGVLSGTPWLVPIVLSIVTAWALYAFSTRVFDRTTGWLTLLLVVLCPFFLFMGVSFMSHVSALCLVSVFLWRFAVWEQEGAGWRLAVAGAALGAAFLSRPYTAAAVAAPFAVIGAASALRRGRGTELAGGVVGFLLLAGLYPLYNAGTTGAPLVPGYLALWGPAHGPGFHVTPWGTRHTPVTGLRNELVDLQLLNLNLFEWPVPGLWPLAVALTAGWLRRRWDRRLVAGLLALPVAYFFYWHRDSYLGPRFLYAGLAFLLPLTARALLVTGRRLKGTRLQLGNLFRAVSGRRWAFTVVVLCFAWAALEGVPGRARAYAAAYSGMRENLPARMRSAGLRRGLVFVKVNAGNRLISDLRGLGASAPAVERAYRKVDFCELLDLERTAREGGWEPGRLDHSLGVLEGRREDLVRAPNLNGDPLLRLRRSRFDPSLHLPADCAAELAYDRSGYGLFTPHLLDNRPDLGGPLVVARDLRGLDAQLEALHPDLPAYLYYHGRFEPLTSTGGDPAEGPRPQAPKR